MAQILYRQMEQRSPSAAVIFPVAVMLLFGFLMTRIIKPFHIPKVTAYILAGILIGPFCLDLIPASFIEGTEFLADIALAFIAFSTGEFFKKSGMGKGTGKVLVITLFEAIMASTMIFLLTRYVMHLNFAFSAVLAALASATAPASTMMTIRETKAKGPFVNTLLQVIAYDDMIALVAYSIAISLSISFISGNVFAGIDVLIPIVKNIAVILLGAIFGLYMKMLIQNRRSTDNRLIIAIALLLGFCGVCAAIGISPLLGCMSMGTVYINITDDDKLFKQLNYFSPPILLLFFVRAGVSFDIGSLLHCAGAVCGIPLLVIGVSYFFVRMIGKYSGAYLGCLFTKEPGTFRKYFGFALIPQAGVAIGLAEIGARALGSDIGEALKTVILSSSVLYELIGPACAKFALYRSKSYMIEKHDDEPENREDFEWKNGFAQSDRISMQSSITEEEKAFTEASEENSVVP